MKRDQNLNCLTAAVLAFCLSFGGVACMVTGIKLEVTSLWLLALACGAAAVFGALCFRLKHGGWVLLICAVLGCMAFSRDLERIGIYIGQARAMLNRMTTLWNHAYGWPRISAGEETLSDLPLILIGSVVAIVATWTVCRRKRAVLAVGISLLPLGSCLVVTDTVPDTGFLFLLLLGLTVLLLTNDLRRRNLHQSLDLTAMASLMAALSLGLLLGLNPIGNYVNQTEEIQESILTWAQDLPAQIKEWGQENAPGTSQTVQTQRENLSTLGRRIERDYPILEVTSELGGTLYLRGQDFDSYDGRTWTATRNRQETVSVDAAMPGSQQGTVRINALRLRTVLYVPYYVWPDITFTGGRLSNDADQTEYTFQRTRPPHNWRTFVNKAPEVDEGIYFTGLYDDATDTWRYRNLPLDTKQRAAEIVGQILTDEQTNTQKADVIAAYVQNSARYDLDPGTMPREETDFALWFLEDQDEGYCVHFATAAVVLLRAAGIDARYVTGYVLQAQAGQTVEVSAKQAHAWAEYFEPRLGTWVVLEATPPEFANWTEATQPENVTAPSTEAQETTTPIPGEDVERPTRPAQTETPEKQETPKADLSGLMTGLKRLLTAVLLVAAVLGQRQLRLRLRRKKQRTGHPNTRALALWREVRMLHRLLGEAPPEELERLAQRAKFSQHTLGKDQLAALEDGVFQAAEVLRGRPWYLQLIYRFLFAAY